MSNCPGEAFSAAHLILRFCTFVSCLLRFFILFLQNSHFTLQLLWPHALSSMSAWHATVQHGNSWQAVAWCLPEICYCRGPLVRVCSCLCCEMRDVFDQPTKRRLSLPAICLPLDNCLSGFAKCLNAALAQLTIHRACNSDMIVGISYGVIKDAFQGKNFN